MAPIPNDPVRLPGVPGTEPLWAHDDDFDHLHMDEEFRKLILKTITDHDVVKLSTVGIDIGSSTSHLLFARVTLQREGEKMSSRFAVVASRSALALADHADPVPERRRPDRRRANSNASSTKAMSRPD